MLKDWEWSLLHVFLPCSVATGGGSHNQRDTHGEKTTRKGTHNSYSLVKTERMVAFALAGIVFCLFFGASIRFFGAPSGFPRRRGHLTRSRTN